MVDLKTKGSARLCARVFGINIASTATAVFAPVAGCVKQIRSLEVPMELGRAPIRSRNLSTDQTGEFLKIVFHREEP
jgi:hypothetical protein